MPLSSQPNKEIPVSLDAANLMKMLWNKLVHFSFRFTKDKEASADIVQEVFLKIVETDKKFNSYIHAAKFLYLSVKHKSLTYNRDLEKEDHDELQYVRLQSNWEDEDTKALDITESLKKVVMELYPLLSDDNKKIFKLYFWQRLSTAEIVRRTGFTAYKVYKVKQRLCETFQKHLAKK